MAVHLGVQEPVLHLVQMTVSMDAVMITVRTPVHLVEQPHVPQVTVAHNVVVIVQLLLQMDVEQIALMIVRTHVKMTVQVDVQVMEMNVLHVLLCVHLLV